MALIGEELRTILGMMPTRDRAGIARGTMADDAVRASVAAEQGNGNAEGQALTMQGMAPPSVNLPGMRPAPPADVTLPDDVATEYASGRKKSGGAPYGTTIPIPAERVITSSPAAAPSQAVATRASDVALAAIEQRNRQAKMMQLIGSLGLIANAFNRNPTSQAATRSSLADMIGGGGAGGGNAIQEIKTLADMRAAEDKSILDAQAKEARILHGMRTQNITRADAEALEAAGTLADRTKPEEMRAAQGIRDLEVRKRRARELAPMIAKERGTDPEVLLAMAEKDPDTVIAMGEREKLVDLSKKETDERMNQRKDTLEDIDVAAYARHFKDPQKLKDAYPDEDPARIDLALQSPTQYKELMKELSTKGQSGPIDPLTKELMEKQLVPAKAQAQEMADANQLSNREMQNLWRKDLKVGSPYTSELLFNVSKTWHKLTNQKLPEGTQVTEKMMQQQVEGTLATLKQLGAGTGLSNADREYAAKAQGGFATTADTLKYLLYLKEKENNFKIDQHNKRIEQSGEGSRYIKNRERMLKVEHPEPNRFMREEIQASKLDKFVEEAVREGKESDPAARAYVESAVGPGVFQHLVREERARQGKK